MGECDCAERPFHPLLNQPVEVTEVVPPAFCFSRSARPKLIATYPDLLTADAGDPFYRLPVNLSRRGAVPQRDSPARFPARDQTQPSARGQRALTCH